jgi:hypothetical protein
VHAYEEGEGPAAAARGAAGSPLAHASLPPLSLPLSTLRLSADDHPGTPGGGGAGGAAGAADAGPGALKRRVSELEGQARQWKAAYEESDRRLRAALEEVSRLEGVGQITDRDALYLRSVIVSGFEAGELPRDGSMFGVLSRLLHFTPQEVERIHAHAGRISAARPAGRATTAAR